VKQGIDSGLFGEEWPVGMCGHQPRAPRPLSREKAQVKRSATKEYNFAAVGGKISALVNQSCNLA
jgi:hypothetical protein